MKSVPFEARTFHWISSDGLKINAKDWYIANPTAVIIILHGLGEHCGRYAHMASFFNQHQIAIVGYDRRGHGISDGKRGHTTSYQAYLDEVSELVKRTKEFYPDIPVFLYGHSMGGNIALNFVLQRKPNIAGLIATGPWIVLHQNPSSLLIAFAKVINTIFPSFTQSNGLNPNHISTVPAEVEKYKNDPLVHDRITSNTGLEMMKAATFLNSFNGDIPVPTLIMHGEDDKIVSVRGSRDFSKRVKGDINYKEWSGFYHEIQNESNSAEVFEYTLRWIDKILKV